MSLIVKAHSVGRDIVRVTPQSAGWRFVGFSAHRLAAGETIEIAQPADELCIVVLGGVVTVSQRDARFAEIGDRRDVFDDRAPYAVYLPDGAAVAVRAHTTAEIGIASAPGGGMDSARLITPAQMKRSVRGSGANERFVCDILRRNSYQGWLVVEAEQDPVVAPAYRYADMGYRHLAKLVQRGGGSVAWREQ